MIRAVLCSCSTLLRCYVVFRTDVLFLFGSFIKNFSGRALSFTLVLPEGTDNIIIKAKRVSYYGVAFNVLLQ